LVFQNIILHTFIRSGGTTVGELAVLTSVLTSPPSAFSAET